MMNKSELEKLILLILVIVFTILYFTKPTTVVSTDSRLDSLRKEYNLLQGRYDYINAYHDTAMIIANKQYDSLMITKYKTIRYYEEHLKNLSDVTIVSDDSITRYISKRIHDRQH